MLTDASLTPTFAATFTAGAVSPAGAGAPTVSPKDRTGVTIDATSAAVGTYTAKISTGASNRLTIAEADGASGIVVANFPPSPTEVGTLTIIVSDAAEATIDLDRASYKQGETITMNVNGVVSSDIATIIIYGDATSADITSGLATSADIFGRDDPMKAVGTTATYKLADDYAVGSYKLVVKAAGDVAISADFAVAAKDQEEQPRFSISRPVDVKTSDLKVNVDFGRAQMVLPAEEIKSVLPEPLKVIIDGDGKIRRDTAASAINVEVSKLTVLPTISTDVAAIGNVAPITLLVRDDQLVAADNQVGIHWTEASIHKFFLGPVIHYVQELRQERLQPARTTAEIANGTFQIRHADTGALPTAQIKPDRTLYHLVVYVEDGKTYDLDTAKDAKVVDPIVLEQTANSNGSSSGGACSVGFGLAAVAGLVVIPIKLRGR